jgi:transposase
MPAATAAHLRQRIFELSQAGHDASRIAGQLSVSPRTVRHLLARWRNAAAPGLAPGQPPGRPLHPDRHPLLRCCLRLRRDNPGWGAGRIRVEMRAMHPGASVPPRAPCSAGSKMPA